MRLFLACLLVLLTACAPRANLMVVPNPALLGTPVKVFVGTSRAKVDGDYGRYQRGGLSFAEFTVSIPPDHKPGALELPTRKGADPATNFVATDAISFPTGTDFSNSLHKALGKTRSGREAVVYVHGFNNSMGDAVFRIAQLTDDLKLGATPISYSWPSAANPLGYAYDRDSALFARDGLEQLLEEIANAGADDILLVAHSMGALLTVETLRQMAIGKNRKVMDRIGGVILISPDIDVELFHQQAVRIGKLPQPFVLFTSARDKALRLSARLTGESERLGNMTDVEQVADLDVTVIDVTSFNNDSLTGHFVAGSSPTLLRILGQLGSVNNAFQRDAPGRVGLLPGTVLTVQNATQIILSPVAALGGATQ